MTEKLVENCKRLRDFVMKICHFIVIKGNVSKAEVLYLKEMDRSFCIVDWKRTGIKVMA
jgi:hypothetical protein